MLLLEPTDFARGLARKKVDVVNYPDGRFSAQFQGVSVPFRVFDKIQCRTACKTFQIPGVNSVQ
jgi:hypothetical protein